MSERAVHVVLMEPRQLHSFWRFVVARHEMFIRRVIERRPPPWTDDPALAGAHYTNVYRELDRVTRAYLHEVAEPSRGAEPYERLWNTFLFRTFNLPTTYQLLGGWQLAREWDGKRAQARLLTAARAGVKVWTGAYMIQARASGRRWMGPGGKIKLWVHRLNWVNKRLHYLMDQMWPIPYLPLVGAQGRTAQMAHAHAVLTQVDGVGGFTAYEMLTDLLYEPAILPFTEDDWVHVGPGALLGLKFLSPGTQRWSTAAQETAVHYLRDCQDELQAQAGVRLRGPAMTLRAVEHQLCEWSKYYRMQRRIRPKRTYSTSRALMDLTPWDDLPAAFSPAPIRKMPPYNTSNSAIPTHQLGDAAGDEELAHDRDSDRNRGAGSRRSAPDPDAASDREEEGRGQEEGPRAQAPDGPGEGQAIGPAAGPGSVGRPEDARQDGPWNQEGLGRQEGAQ